MRKLNAALSLRGILAFSNLNFSWGLFVYGSKRLSNFHQICLENWQTNSIEMLISEDNENLFK